MWSKCSVWQIAVLVMAFVVSLTLVACVGNRPSGVGIKPDVTDLRVRPEMAERFIPAESTTETLVEEAMVENSEVLQPVPTVTNFVATPEPTSTVDSLPSLTVSVVKESTPGEAVPYKLVIDSSSLNLTKEQKDEYLNPVQAQIIDKLTLKNDTQIVLALGSNRYESLPPKLSRKEPGWQALFNNWEDEFACTKTPSVANLKSLVIYFRDVDLGGEGESFAIFEFTDKHDPTSLERISLVTATWFSNWPSSVPWRVTSLLTHYLQTLHYAIVAGPGVGLFDTSPVWQERVGSENCGDNWPYWFSSEIACKYQLFEQIAGVCRKVKVTVKSGVRPFFAPIVPDYRFYSPDNYQVKQETSREIVAEGLVIGGWYDKSGTETVDPFMLVTKIDSPSSPEEISLLLLRYIWLGEKNSQVLKIEDLE